MYTERNTEAIKFILLDLPGLSREDDNEEVNKVAALVWYGFHLGKNDGDEDGDQCIAAGIPKLIWSEPIDLSIISDLGSDR